MLPSSRRKFVKQIAGTAAYAFVFNACTPKMSNSKGPSINPLPGSFFEISLAEWSLHKSLFAKKMTNLEFPVIAKKEYGINAVEYVNQFFKDKANDTKYLGELLKICKDNAVKNHLIMIDGEGDLGDVDTAIRTKAVENHYKWVDAAKFLGCATIRVNAFGKGSAEDVQKAAVDGLSKLGEYAAKENINVIVENHGSYTSNGQWIASVMKSVGKSNVGLLPDFNNFCVKRDNGQAWGGKCIEEYDRYKGVAEMMPYAKGASAKTIDFDEAGNCIETDYPRMLKLIKDTSFRGYLGIEYEGSKISEMEGIKKTKALLEKTAAAI
ncbi:MAG: sugar phosphate isomerase/epimerase family protein [Ferruginibacter sp.]|nr:sugar phosphate isomerase/epimerase family protein [Ferruginibacter sp.]